MTPSAYVIIESLLIIRDRDGEILDALDPNDTCYGNPPCGGCTQCLLPLDDFEVEWLDGIVWGVE